MAHYAIVVDLDRCIGCHGCEIACKNENEVELGSFWNKVVQVGPFGDYPHLHQYFLWCWWTRRSASAASTA